MRTVPAGLGVATTGPRQPRARRKRRPERELGDQGPAVAVDLDDVLAGEAPRRQHGENEHLVDDVPAVGLAIVTV